ncbi:MAG: thioredoxin domain-containing protein, partial [Terriglobales bacterium]
MKRVLSLALLCLVGLAMGLFAQHRASAGHLTQAQIKTRIHAFLERSLGWQNLDKLEILSISAPDASGLRTVRVKLAKGDQSKLASYLITPDDREIIEGEAEPLSGDPWAANRAKLNLRGAPATGSANAPVTIVEFSDLECPYCKEESASLDQLMNVDPDKARIVFKFFPLVKIHPWSMPAAEAGECVAQQGSLTFW